MSAPVGTRRQYVAVRFRPADVRTYTYEWDGEPVKPGDWVKVPDRDSDGWKRVEVVHVHYTAPLFPTKAILGLVPQESEFGGEMPL